MKKKNLIFFTIFISIMILPINVSASKLSHTYEHKQLFIDSIYTYNYFIDYKYETINNNLSSKEDKVKLIKQEYIGNMTCGGLTNFKFHKRIPRLTITFYNLLKVAIPVLLVIKGMMDWFKAMTAGKEDEMKKNQKKFINRLIAGVCAFIVFILVETIIGWIAPKTGDGNAMNCVNCFINNSGCLEVTNSN